MDPSQGSPKNGSLHFPDARREACNASQLLQPRLAYPPSAKWHKSRINGKQPSTQMYEQAELQGHKFMVASDYLVGKDVKKMFASYPSSGDFIQQTFLKTEDKNFYEVIREGKPCKLFLDIEWIGQDDSERTVIRHLVDKLNAYTKVKREANLHNIADSSKIMVQLDLEILLTATVCSKVLVFARAHNLRHLHEIERR